MKAIIPVWGLLLVLPGAASAQALRGREVYVQANIGSSVAGNLDASGVDSVLGPFSVHESMKPGFTGSLLIGAPIGSGLLSVEAEGLYVHNAVKSPDLNAALGTDIGLKSRSYGGVANLKIEPRPMAFGSFRVSPYIAAGIGYGVTSVTILGQDYSGDGMIWQAKTGVAFRATPSLTWDLGYRYVHLPTFNTNQYGLDARLKTDAQVVMVGLRYSFGR